MSGGSRGYIYIRIRDDLAGKMYDAELDDLMDDIADLAHDAERYDSCDIGAKTYHESVAKFKEKWFGTDRTDRLIGYIDTKIDEVKRDLYRLVIPERHLKDMGQQYGRKDRREKCE